MGRYKKHSKYATDKISGDASIVGLVDNYGYLIYSVRCKELQVVPYNIAVSMFDRFSFNNAILKNGNLCCSVDNLPSYTTTSNRPKISDLVPKNPNVYYIIARIILGNNHCAYRVATGDCHILDLRDTDVINYIKHGGIILNASLVDGKLDVVN